MKKIPGRSTVNRAGVLAGLLVLVALAPAQGQRFVDAGAFRSHPPTTAELVTLATTELSQPAPALFAARPEGTEPNPAAAQLWPNPARASVTLSGQPAASVTLRDLLGRLVQTTRFDASGHARLDVRGLAPGMYIVQGGGIDQKLVVE